MAIILTMDQVNRIIDRKLLEFSLFGNKGRKAAKVLYEEALNATLIKSDPKIQNCKDKIADPTKREKCLDKVVMESIIILINEIDSRIGRCGTNKDCIEWLLGAIISLARYSKEKYGQNLDDMATKIVQKYGYSGIKWSVKGGLKDPSFAKTFKDMYVR